MNVEKLPTRLLTFATLVFLMAGIGLVLLLSNYHPAVPSAVAVEASPVDSGENTYRLSARDTLLWLEPNQLLSFKTFNNSLPRYFSIAEYAPTKDPGVFNIVFAKDGAPSPEEVENGFIHLRQPINGGLMDLMMR